MDQPPRRTVYVLRSETDPSRHYVGLTSNLARRLACHNAAQNTHTAKLRPWRVLVALEFEHEETAARFERYLKRGSGRAFALRHFSPVGEAHRSHNRSASGPDRASSRGARH